jgi:sec-independent protein translocase protein TatA
MNVGPWQLLIIVGVIVLLFGAGAIPKFARSIGRAKKEFQKGIREGEDDDARERDKKRRADDGEEKDDDSDDDTRDSKRRDRKEREL